MAKWADFKGSVPDRIKFGTPARDLTDEDRAGMTEAEIRGVEESPLYSVRPERKGAAADETTAGTTKKGGGL